MNRRVQIRLDRGECARSSGHMPTYSYVCKDCEHTYDALQSMKEDPDTVCPSCGGRVDRLIGAGAGLVFKGSGFYVTDYKAKSQPPAGESGSSGEKSAPAAAAASTPAAASTASSTSASSPGASSGSSSGSSSAGGSSSGSSSGSSGSSS